MCNIDYFIIYLLFNSEKVKRCKCGSNMAIFRSASDSAIKVHFQFVNAFNLRERKSVVKRVTIIKT